MSQSPTTNVGLHLMGHVFVCVECQATKLLMNPERTMLWGEAEAQMRQGKGWGTRKGLWHCPECLTAQPRASRQRGSLALVK